MSIKKTISAQDFVARLFTLGRACKLRQICVTDELTPKPTNASFLFERELIIDSPQFSEGVITMKALSVATTIAGAATLVFASYIILASLPDLRRYIKISTM